MTDSKTLPTRIFELADNNTKTVITSFHVFRNTCVWRHGNYFLNDANWSSRDSNYHVWDENILNGVS